ncbi:MAG: DNA-formamidopyrimidine glycosylase family protein [Balneolaceae bacterium]
MPELPDVEIFKKHIDSTSLHKRIADAEVSDSGVLENISGKSLEKKLSGKVIQDSFRHGKYLFLKLSKGQELSMHFGMTGFPEYLNKDDEKPKHVRLLLNFEDGGMLAYDSQRKLGKIGLFENHEEFVEVHEMGPDALDEGLDFESFHNIFKENSGMIKPALMNQSKVAGIGNIYADEILFQARLHPKTKAGKLEKSDWEKIFKAMKNVLQTAIDCKVDKSRFPDHYILTNRTKGADCPKGCGDKIQTIKVSGRTSYYCPDCQEKK